MISRTPEPTLSTPMAPALGTPAPNFPLPDGRCSSRRGAPLILSFSSSDWNPARDETLRLFNELAREFAPSNSRLLDLRARPDGCTLSTDEGEEEVALHLLDPHGDTAAIFGVQGQNAQFVLDEEGIVRWKCVWAQDAAPRAGEVIEALQRLTRHAPAAATRQDTTTQDTTTQAATELAVPLSRRAFMASALAASLALAAGALLGSASAQNLGTRNEAEKAPGVASELMPLTLLINGQKRELRIEPRVALLDALRENLGMTGTKKGCDHGQCGACTVHIDGERALSCLTFAVMNDGRAITTIEGLAQGQTLHPVQQAFIEHDGFQCGYCTPGQIMSAVGLLREDHAHSDAEIREAMSGNLCRCGAYPNIIAAIKSARTA